MLKLTPPELWMRALAHYIIERQSISRFCLFYSKFTLALQNPGEHFSLYGICAVVLVLRILTEILFSGLEVNRESLCCELYRLVGTIVGKNLNIESEIQNFTNNLKIGLKLPQALKRTLIGTAPLIASCST